LDKIINRTIEKDQWCQSFGAKKKKEIVIAAKFHDNG